MNKVNTVVIKGEAYGLLVVTNPDLHVSVFAIPIEEWETNELSQYHGNSIENLPNDIYEKIEYGVYPDLQVSHVVRL